MTVQSSSLSLISFCGVKESIDSNEEEYGCYGRETFIIK
jgi:hypothetical protein